MERMSDTIRRDVERALDTSFHTWDLMDYTFPSVHFDPENSYYRMKIRTDDNGHVKVKTIEKEPGKPEKVQLEEFDRGNAAIEQRKSGNKDTAIEQEKASDVQITDETRRTQDTSNRGIGQSMEQTTQRTSQV